MSIEDIYNAHRGKCPARYEVRGIGPDLPIWQCSDGAEACKFELCTHAYWLGVALERWADWKGACP